MKPHLCSFAALLLALLAPLPAAAPAAPSTSPGSPEDREPRLAQLPRPWLRPIHRITFEEYDATLKYWARLHPDIFSFQELGRSHDGQPVYAVRITDSAVPDADKQAALVTALHGGPERSGATTALHLIERLIGDSRFARETRRRQIVHIVPIANPHAFFATDRFGNREGIDLYDPPLAWWDLKQVTLAAPDKTPELAAVLALVDEVRPEVHLDLHGTGLQAFPPGALGDRAMREGQTMFEVSACSYSNCGVRPWDPRVTEAMVRAGQEAGYGSDPAEADAQRCFWNADHDGMLYPEFDGRCTYVCAVTPRGIAALDADPGAFVADLRRFDGIDAGAVARFFALGPEHRLTARPKPSPKGARILHGIGFRLRVPYRAPELLDVALNGHALRPGATDGCDAWYADGYTQVQINVPPAKTRAADLYVVTCAYNPGERRAYGWSPPEPVLRELRGR